ncbi:MAG: hypothetical protein HWE30_17170 [Methylocystaceae bacterium]|nr:hypothetical protein [Methylocystaceae bacterium]
MGSAQLSPRVLSAYERLETAVERLQKACASQADKVDASEVARLQAQIDGLKEDNLALSEELSAHSEADYDNQLEKLSDKIDALQGEKEDIQSQNERLKSMNANFSQRLEKLIGNVQQVLEED